MAVTPDTVSNSDTISPSGSTLTFTHTVNSGSNRALLVAAFSRTELTTGVTFNGSTMNAYIVKQESVSNGLNAYLFLMTDTSSPALPAGTTTNGAVVITAASAPSFYLAGVAWSFFGVEPTSPIDDVWNAEESSSTDIDFTGRLLHPSVNGDLIVDACAMNSGTAASPINETRTSTSVFLALTQGRYVASSYLVQSTATDLLLGWNTGTLACNASYVAAALKAAAGGGPSKFWIFGPR